MGLRTRVLLSMCSSFRALISSRHFLDGSPSRNFTTLSLFSFCLVFVALPEMLGPYVGTKSSLLAVQHGRRSVVILFCMGTSSLPGSPRPSCSLFVTLSSCCKMLRVPVGTKSFLAVQQWKDTLCVN
ncbi:hypothetical protein CY35_08G030400 [Sphagnum magellanicum]|nr:hypothetical protein CY35_08G030400 [Sphagnum magellanicum]